MKDYYLCSDRGLKDLVEDAIEEGAEFLIIYPNSLEIYKIKFQIEQWDSYRRRFYIHFEKVNDRYCLEKKIWQPGSCLSENHDFECLRKKHGNNFILFKEFVENNNMVATRSKYAYLEIM